MLLNRHFALLWQGQAISQLGNQAFLIAATYLTLERTGSSSLVAAVMMASTLPLAVVGPIGGAFADRHSRRAILVTTDLLRGVAVGGVGLALVASDASALHVPLLVAVAAISGFLAALFAPAAQALLPELVPAERLAPANALMHMSGQACTLLGQAAGGALYVAWGAAPLLLFDAASFVYAGVSTSFIPPDRPMRRATGRLKAVLGQYASELREGMAHVSRGGLVPLLVTFAGVNFLFMPVFVLLPLYVRDVLVRGPEWYGFLLAASAAGAVTGSAASALLPTRWPRSHVVLGCIAGIALGVLALAYTERPWIAFPAFALIGTLASVINVVVITLIQSAVSSEVRGRVMAIVIAISTAAVPLGMAAGGVAGDVFRDSLAAVFAACGIALSVLVLFAWWSSAMVIVEARRSEPSR